MNIAETPIAALEGIQPPVGDGVHLWRGATGKASGSPPTCTARHNWSMPRAARCRSPRQRGAGWCHPIARYGCRHLEHSIDVLADIEMRTLYFDQPWLKQGGPHESLDAEFVVRVSRLLHELILALFDGAATRSAPRY